MKDAKTNFDSLLKQEEALEFKKFSYNDALDIGLLIIENAKTYNDPITIEIALNGLVVFRFFSAGSIPDSEIWLKCKRNSVNLMSMSSLRFMYWLEMNSSTILDRKLDPNCYAACGGGFPIILHGMGVVGSICVSGFQNHLDDHQLVVDTLTEFLK